MTFGGRSCRFLPGEHRGFDSFRGLLRLHDFSRARLFLSPFRAIGPRLGLLEGFGHRKRRKGLGRCLIKRKGERLRRQEGL
jgi:hypothetical protein